MNDLNLRIAAEFERLANRALGDVERDVVRTAAQGGSVWVEGLRPDAFALLALALAEGAGKRVLFVAPDAELLIERQHRFGSRANVTLLGERASTRVATNPGVFFAAADLLAGDALAKFFPEPPDYVFLEQAHAASSSAFEFRPVFARVASLVDRFPTTRWAASAAHVTSDVRDEALRILGFDADGDPSKTDRRTTFFRETFGDASLQVLVENPTRSLGETIAPLPRPLVVLCPTPAAADAVYAELRREQLPCHRYHGGLSARERATELLQFALPGRRAVLVATSSFGPASGFAGESEPRFAEDFGRGYTRADLRSIVHVGWPASLEQYGLELGLLRRSRDEESDGTDPSSYAVLVPTSDDGLLGRSLLARKRPSPETLEVVVGCLKKQPRGAFATEKSLIDGAGGAERPVRLVLAFLKDTGALETKQEGERPSYRPRSLALLEKTGRELARHFERLREGDEERRARLAAFVARSSEESVCRVRSFLGPEVDACGRCDLCEPEARLEGGTHRSFERLVHRRRAPVSPRDAARVAEGREEEDDDLFFDEEGIAADGA